MTQEQWQHKTDVELVEEAQTGLRGQGATVEMMRRLREAIVKQQRATNWLTVALLIFAVVQTILILLQIFWRK